ncbi:MAG: hypothetical protein HY996_00195 [Micrococcales bacterium]|nr:hypothetical protein [Micrococcales bacterium]
MLYSITRSGPEPLEKRTEPLDYAHYVDKQLAAAVDSILPLLGTTFDRVTGAQMTLCRGDGSKSEAGAGASCRGPHDHLAGSDPRVVQAIWRAYGR